MSRVKDLYTASYIGVVSVLFYPNYSILLCFVKINIYHKSIIKYHTIYFLRARIPYVTNVTDETKYIHTYKFVEHHV